MKKILITGSQGFIGSYLCAEFLSKGYKVIGIDNFSKYGPLTRPHDSHPNFELIEMDVIDLPRDKILPKLQDVEYIISGAAMIGGITYFHKYAYDLLATNERIMASTFDLAIKLHEKGIFKRIIAISSSMVFENTTVYPTPEINVKTCAPPLSTYGFQKLAVEYFCKGANEQYGKDIARGIRMALESDCALNEDFNISTPVATSVKELSKVVWDILKPGQAFNTISDKAYEYDVQKRVPNTSKALSLLGFQAEIGLEESVREVIEYMRNK